MKTATKFVADDGQEFDSRKACEAHESGLVEQKLVGLTAEQVAAALARTDLVLAKAIETVGNRITRARIEAGDKRLRKPKEVEAAVSLAPNVSGRKRASAGAAA